MALLLVPFVFASQALGSELIARNAKNVKLEVSRDGTSALLSYTANGRNWYVLASGAVNARQPKSGAKQVSFRLRRSTTRPAFAGGCSGARPDVPFLVTACSAGGSSWAAQEWQRALPNFGVAPTGLKALPELHLSHWSGAVAQLSLRADWSFAGKWQHIYGSLTYHAKAVYGFGTTRFGSPTDAFGRVVYLDTRDSAYGKGWVRENGFVTHNPTGVFCYDLTPHRNGLIPAGSAYRASAIGPGVTPDVSAFVLSSGAYDPAVDQAANTELAQMNDRLCRPS